MPNIVNITTFPGLLDLLAPHYCRGCGLIGKPICDRCKNYILSSNCNLCPICKQPNPTGICTRCTGDPTIEPLPPSYIIGTRSGLLDVVIHDYKYHSVRALAAPLAVMINEKLPHLQQKSIIVPLPTIAKHVRVRGLDHTYLIAKKLASLCPSYAVSRLLIRNSSSVQVGATHQQRLAQAATAYAINRKIKPQKDVTYILLDDVWTTGASLRAAVKILQANGINSIILAILSLSVL